jgi:hypothetical protein
VVTTFDGVREVAHSGSTGGYRTWLGRYPDHGVSVAVMCNSAQANPTQLGRETARLWNGAVPAAKPAPFAMDAATLTLVAGMYRKVRDNTVVELRVRDGKMTMDPGGVQLTPAGADRFSAGERLFLLAKDAFRVVTPDGDTVYERVQPAHPAAADLAPLAGDYSSPDTGTTLTVAVKEGELTLAVGSNAPARLRPTFQDAFMMQGTAIRFFRGADGKVSRLSAGDDRAWDLPFSRVR